MQHKNVWFVKPNMWQFIASCVDDICVCDSTSTETVVVGLKPFTSFRFAVRSHTSSLIGPFGDEIRCRTDEGREFFQFSVYMYVLHVPSVAFRSGLVVKCGFADLEIAQLVN